MLLNLYFLPTQKFPLPQIQSLPQMQNLPTLLLSQIPAFEESAKQLPAFGFHQAVVPVFPLPELLSLAAVPVFVAAQASPLVFQSLLSPALSPVFLPLVLFPAPPAAEVFVPPEVHPAFRSLEFPVAPLAAEPPVLFLPLLSLFEKQPFPLLQNLYLHPLPEFRLRKLSEFLFQLF